MNMDKPKLNKLSTEVINQIAAGEVIERPASIVKELVDNSIDAQSTKIEIKVKNGGIDLIEVLDNGTGIPKENISSVFDSHTTSKIQNIEDLNTLLSLGFRGEALSTITSVSRVKLLSKFESEDLGNEINYNEKGKSLVKSAAKEQGTTVKVENIFYNIPARLKYLKSAQTEYRKIYELLLNYFLIFPNIQFILYKDGKVVVDIPIVRNSKAGEISKERVIKFLGDQDFLKLFYDGAGIKVNGYIAHPSTHKSKNSKSYIFLNNRPITDRGVIRAVYEGYSRYLPHGERVDFIINIIINPELVDVNVHPRKEEVRFENPFRVYSAIEEAVKHTLNKELSFEDTSSSESKSSVNSFSSLRDSFNKSKTGLSSTPKEYEQNNLYLKNKSSSVKDTLLFSKELLKSSSLQDYEPFEPSNQYEDIVNLFQLFNKYIVIEFTNGNLWIIDQHAAAERINFEKLMNNSKNIDIQNFLVPVELPMKKEEILFLEENKKFFSDLGILFDIEKEKILLKTVPVEFANSDFKQIFNEIFELEENLSLLKKNFKKLRDDVLATISCHSSIRSGQKLSRESMLDLYERLSKCENPYSCPHGRPAVWKLTLSEIDRNFERTY
jgi:DNA mismatch repair protein MutL